MVLVKSALNGGDYRMPNNFYSKYKGLRAKTRQGQQEAKDQSVPKGPLYLRDLVDDIDLDQVKPDTTHELSNNAAPGVAPSLPTLVPRFLRPSSARKPTEEEQAALKAIEQIRHQRQHEMQVSQQWRNVPYNKKLSRDIQALSTNPDIQRALAIYLKRNNISPSLLGPEAYRQLATQIQLDLAEIANYTNGNQVQILPYNPNDINDPMHPANPNNIALQLQTTGAQFNPLFVRNENAERDEILDAQNEQRQDNMEMRNEFSQAQMQEYREDEQTNRHALRNEVAFEAAAEAAIDAPRLIPEAAKVTSELSKDAMEEITQLMKHVSGDTSVKGVVENVVKDVERVFNPTPRPPAGY